MSSAAPSLSDALHHLVVLYLSVAYETDHNFEPSEELAVLQHLLLWEPSLERADAQAIVDTAVRAVGAGFSDNVEAHARALAGTLTAEQRRRVLADLGQIARADGYLSVEEASIIRRVRAVWGSHAEG